MEGYVTHHRSLKEILILGECEESNACNTECEEVRYSIFPTCKFNPGGSIKEFLSLFNSFVYA